MHDLDDKLDDTEREFHAALETSSVWETKLVALVNEILLAHEPYQNAARETSRLGYTIQFQQDMKVYFVEKKDEVNVEKAVAVSIFTEEDKKYLKKMRIALIDDEHQ